MPGGGGASGRLVVVDRAGRAVKAFPLSSGAATIGRSFGCDVRVLQPTIELHHATLLVHRNQVVIRNEGSGETLVNEVPVSVCALQHGDVITLSGGGGAGGAGGRRLRWEYDNAPLAAHRPLAPEPALYKPARSARTPRRVTAAAPTHADRSIQRSLLQHRASMPGNAGGKQVAIVQPQRRDNIDQIDLKPRSAPSSPRAPPPRPPSAPAPAPAPRLCLTKLPSDTTKATLWIESRKSSPRKNVAPATPSPRALPPRRAASARKTTPLRVAVLRGAGSAHKQHRVTKIQAPLTVDHMKQAALMLMAGHTRAKPSPAPAPALVVSVVSPGGRRHSRKGRKSASSRKSSRGSSGKSVSVVSIADTSSVHDSSVTSARTPHSPHSAPTSPLLPSPKKSSLRDPKADRNSRKNESIKFDFSNLDNYTRDDDTGRSSNRSSTRRARSDVTPEDDITLHYSDSSPSLSPSPRPSRPPHSRSSTLLAMSGSPLKKNVNRNTSTPPASPSARKSLRGGIMIQKALESTVDDNSKYSRRSSRTLTESLNATGESTTRNHLESYSIVDLVSSRESHDSSKSVYDSAGSTRTSSIVFGTPQTDGGVGGGRSTRSALDPHAVTSSTPYARARASARSQSSPRKSPPDRSTRSSAGTRRSKSLSTPENSEETQRHISINSTRISRASRSRSRLDGDSLFVSDIGDGEESPRTSRRNTSANLSLSHAISVLSPKKSSPGILARTSSPIASPKSASKNSSPKRTSGRISSPIISTKAVRQSLKRASQSAASPVASPKRASKRTLSPASPKRASERTSSFITIPKSDQSTSSPVSSPKRASERTSSFITIPKSATSSPVSSPKRATLRTSSPRQTPRASRSNPGTPVSPSLITSPKRVGLKPLSPIARASTGVLSPRSDKRSYRSKQASPRSPSNSPAGSAPARRSNLALDSTYASSENDGTITPENTTAPIEQTTPVLSIQNLLDSSRSSFASQKSPRAKLSVNVKRKTIGALRSEEKARRSGPQSKSFSASARRSLRSLRLSAGSDPLDYSVISVDEESATPKSAVKLVQEAVKNKHSTEKKPQSKRSIIDDLNDSDLVKQLFNSPVKRKLSQSMTAFSRMKLFDDDDDVRRRPARNTIANPLATPPANRSPDKTGSKRTTRNTQSDSTKRVKGSPRTRRSVRNDLTNVSGVKELLRTPRARESVKNDLTNVSGVKSPRNRPPVRDSGVKSSIRAQRRKASPRNDLSDVTGVRALFTRKSIANDLRNVSGVKKTLAKSPKNDLRDVRGVKLLFRQSKSRGENSHDLSGVEELFDESNAWSASRRDPEALFDQLIGKPPIKAVYSKSFLTKRPQKGKKLRRAKSLHTSIDLITNNVEQWLEQELQKHLHKDQSSSKVSRALQQLATDTVDGSLPIRTSRTRDSTLQRLDVTDKKKSASEIYDTHTLPIKKRSLSASARNKSNISKSSVLPIKKRLVLHSTPVKGTRYNLTMNASELGRVSPIPAAARAADNTIAADTTLVNRSNQTKISPKRKGKRVSKAIISESVVIEELPKSPTRGTESTAIESALAKESSKNNQSQSPRQRGNRREHVEEPANTLANCKQENKGARAGAGAATASDTAPGPQGRPARTRRTRNNAEKQESLTESLRPKGRRGKAKSGVETEEAEPAENKPSPKKTRGTRAKAQSPAKPARAPRAVPSAPAPRATRSTRGKPDASDNTKRRRNSLVITKKPPVMSPKPVKSTRKQTKEEAKPATLKTTRQKTETVVEISPSAKKTRAKLVIAKLSPKLNTRSRPARGARGGGGARSDAGAWSDGGAGGDNNSNKQSPVAPKRGRRNVDTEKAPSPKKTRKTEKATPKSPQKPKPSPPKRGRAAVDESQDVAPPAKRGRNAKNITQKLDSPKKIRGKNDSQEIITAPAGRSRRGKPAPAPAPSAPAPARAGPSGRKRKATGEQSPLPAKIARSTRARKTDNLSIVVNPQGKRTVTPVKEKPTRGKKQETIESPVKEKSTRGKKQETIESPVKEKSTRGKKQETIESPVKEKSTRGKKQETIESPVKEKSTRGKKQETIESPVKEKSTRGKKKESIVEASRSTRQRKTKTSDSPPEKRQQREKRSAKKVISSKAKASPVKKAPVKKVPAKTASPTKKVSPVKKAAPAKKASAVKKASPAKKPSPIKKGKASPIKKGKASPVKKTKASPVKKTKPSPVKKAEDSPVKKTRGGKKPVAAASPAARRRKAPASPAKGVAGRGAGGGGGGGRGAGAGSRSRRR